MEDQNLLKEIQGDYKKAKREKKEGKKVKVEEKKKRSINWKVWGLLFVLVVIAIAYSGERYHNWRLENEWQFPIDWLGFVRKVEARIISPLADSPEEQVLTKQQIVDASRHPVEINMIWTLESGKGTNEDPQALHNYCKSKGETNEFGWGGMSNMICFKTFQEAVDRVSQWLDQREAEMYCYYSTGKRVSDCYYMDRVNVEKM